MYLKLSELVIVWRLHQSVCVLCHTSTIKAKADRFILVHIHRHAPRVTIAHRTGLSCCLKHSHSKKSERGIIGRKATQAMENGKKKKKLIKWKKLVSG